MTAPRQIAHPRPGFFRMRLVKKGPQTCARIFLPCPMVPTEPDVHPDLWCLPLDRSRFLEAEAAGEAIDVMRVWTSGRPITESEFEFMRADAAWAKEWAPAEPVAQPKHSINLAEMPPLF